MNDKSTSFHPKAPINCNGKILTFDSPRIMGVLNITPDSFYDGGYYDRSDLALNRCRQMIEEGADIIDIGGASTRPGSSEVSVEEELFRVLPVLESIKKEFPSTIVSIDTYHSEVARKAYETGADMINDISGGTFDPVMVKTVAETGLPYIIMHIQGTPATMQKHPEYENVVREVREFLFAAAGEARAEGIGNVIIDPGFGFGKNTDHNYLLLKNLQTFREKGYPVLAGVSRKSMINRVLGTMPESALNGTTVVNTIALLNGADIIRVHDVKEAVQARDVVNYYRTL
jgi:dihydropteroate synthase